MSQLDQYRNFNVDGLDVDELIALSVFGRQLRAEYEALQLEEPDWVDIQLKTLRREIHSRAADAREARIREIDSRLNALMTADEKRAELLKERERLTSVKVGA